jgi:hypothetical protein
VETKAEEAESSAPAPPQGGKDLAVAAPVSNREPRERRLQPVALLATASEHPKLKALAHEILKDWQAVVATDYSPIGTLVEPYYYPSALLDKGFKRRHMSK